MNLQRLCQTIQLNLRGNAAQRAEYLRSKDIFGLVGNRVGYSPRKIPLYPKLIKLHNNVNIAAGVTFITHDVSDNMLNNTAYIHGEKLPEKIGCIEIMDNVFIGANSTILYDVRIGSNVIIGAGSMVTRDIPDNSVAAGVPAKVIGTFDDFVARRIMWNGYCGHQQPIRGISVPDETVKFFWERFEADRRG